MVKGSRKGTKWVPTRTDLVKKATNGRTRSIRRVGGEWSLKRCIFSRKGLEGKKSRRWKFCLLIASYQSHPQSIWKNGCGKGGHHREQKEGGHVFGRGSRLPGRSFPLLMGGPAICLLWGSGVRKQGRENVRNIEVRMKGHGGGICPADYPGEFKIHGKKRQEGASWQTCALLEKNGEVSGNK